MQVNDLAIGRQALSEMVKNPKNPWEGSVAHWMQKAKSTHLYFQTRITNGGWDYSNKSQDFVETNEGPDDIDIDQWMKRQPAICEDICRIGITRWMRKHVPCDSDTAAAIISWLTSKGKYPEGHPKYKIDDERKVLTTRFEKVLKKLDAGTLLSIDEKMQKRAAKI